MKKYFSQQTSRSPKKLPRYIEIADTLRNELLEKKYSQDRSFPTEAELCDRFNCARHTVRQGLNRLADEGLISRKHGSGTKVSKGLPRKLPLRQKFGSMEEILQYANDTVIKFKRLDAVAIPAVISEHLGLETSGLWFPFCGTRVKSEQFEPICYTVAWVHPDLREIVPEIEVEGLPIFRQIEIMDELSVSRITQDIQAVPTRGYISDKLKLEDGSPALRVLRCSYDNADRLFEISASYHTGKLFSYSVTLTN